MKTSLLSKTRLVITQCLITAVVLVSFTDANAQRHRGNQPSLGFETTQSYVGRYLYQGQHIDLTSQLSLNQSLRQGKQVMSIKVIAQKSSYNSKLILKLNGQRLEAQTVSQYSGPIVFYVPRLQAYDSLSIKVKGEVYVERVLAELKSPHRSPQRNRGGINNRGVLRARVNQYTQGFQTLKVRQLIKQQTGMATKGLKVQSVIIKASSNRGRAKATLLINGQQVGYAQTIPVHQTRLVFNLDRWSQNIIGQDIKSIQVQLQGKVTTQMVAIKVDQSMNPRNGGHRRY